MDIGANFGQSSLGLKIRHRFWHISRKLGTKVNAIWMQVSRLGVGLHCHRLFQIFKSSTQVVAVEPNPAAAKERIKTTCSLLGRSHRCMFIVTQPDITLSEWAFDQAHILNWRQFENALELLSALENWFWRKR